MTSSDKDNFLITLVALIFLLGMIWGIRNNNKQRDIRQKALIERYRVENNIPLNPKVEKMSLNDQYFYYKLKGISK